jgi:hypothetical protein
MVMARKRYEQHTGNTQVTRMIVDWEGMATEFLARLHAEGRRVVTILQTNQYRDLSSFSDAGTFVPLSTDAHGHVFREVAPARITLPREDHPDNPLCLQVALIRDLRRTVPVRPDPEEAEVPARWDSDLPPDERTWWREGWQATAAPAQETMAKLIPIVTAQETPTINAIELAQASIHRWPAQEKVIKDYLLPLGLDTNHGCAKIAVENSEVAKDEHAWNNVSLGSSNGHRAQASARPRPADGGSGSALRTTSAVWKRTFYCGSVHTTEPKERATAHVGYLSFSRKPFRSQLASLTIFLVSPFACIRSSLTPVRSIQMPIPRTACQGYMATIHR